jgi:hypothetical protein
LCATWSAGKDEQEARAPRRVNPTTPKHGVSTLFSASALPWRGVELWRSTFAANPLSAVHLLFLPAGDDAFACPPAWMPYENMLIPMITFIYNIE